MERGQRLAWAQLKVGLFVVAALIVAAVGILSIGNVSIFAPKTKAKTYLSGVSGLKPGDLVLLQGVEVGNVAGVQITRELPKTIANQQASDTIAQNLRKMEALKGRIEVHRAKFHADSEEYKKLLSTNPSKAAILGKQLQRDQSIIENESKEFENAHSGAENAKASLQNIEVSMVLERKYEDWIKKDSSVSLGSVGLLGDKYVEISLGRTPLPPDRDKDGVIVIAGSKTTDFRQIITGVDDVIANFGILSERMENIMAKFDEGQGSIGKFINDPAFYDNLNRTVLSANGLIENVQNGRGTVGRLINDSTVYDSLAATSDKFQKVVDRLNTTEGTAGKFINDPALYDSANRVVASVDVITERINRGEGNLGKLSKDEKLYDDVRASVQKLNALMDDINNGKGTLGKLAKDQEVYNNINQASSEIVKLIYDFRKDPKKYLTIKFEIF